MFRTTLLDETWYAIELAPEQSFAFAKTTSLGTPYCVPIILIVHIVPISGLLFVKMSCILEVLFLFIYCFKKILTW